MLSLTSSATQARKTLSPTGRHKLMPLTLNYKLPDETTEQKQEWKQLETLHSQFSTTVHNFKDLQTEADLTFSNAFSSLDMLRETGLSGSPGTSPVPRKEEGDFSTAVDLLEETLGVSREGEVSVLVEKVRDGIVVTRHILCDMIKRPQLQLRAITLELLWKQLLVAIDSVAELDKVKVEEERKKMKYERESAEARYMQEISELAKQLEGAKAQSRSQMWILKNALKSLRDEKVFMQLMK